MTKTWTRRVGCAAAVVLGAVSMAACSGDDDGGPQTTAASDSANVTAAPVPSPTVDLVWQGVKDGPSLRFVAEVTNPGPQTLTGVATEWTAVDATGVVVGTRKTKLPDLPAGYTLSYVGGAGAQSLTGTPANVTITITDPGDFQPRASSPFLQVDDVQIAPTSAGGTTDITGDISAPTEVRTKSIETMLVVRNPDGTVLLADVDGDLSAPDTLPAGSKARVRFRSVGVPFPDGATASIQAWTSK